MALPNAEQAAAITLAKDGHNFALLGHAGTEKSFVLGKKIMQLPEKKIAVTATTGIAGVAYPGGTTIHSWCGVNDGSMSSAEIVQSIKQDKDRWRRYLERVTSTDILLIDEISMFSAEMLEKTEVVIRTIRGNNQVFGGLQVVVAGDFLQLPPVNGDWAFSSPVWNLAFNHVIVLREQHRQHNADLQAAVYDLAMGGCSDRTSTFFKCLDNTIICNSSVHLFSRNEDADIHNIRAITAFPGESKAFPATDTGSTKKKGVLAPPQLVLKKGCPVVLLKNISSELVNGLRGVVTYPFLPEVMFPSIRKKERFTEKILFTNTMNDGWREQIPLNLAFALTVHKAQGMTLPNATVHCERMNMPGQLYVALSRVKQPECLKVVNFRGPTTPDPSVLEYLNKQQDRAEMVMTTLHCCRNREVPDVPMTTTGLIYQMYFDSEAEDENADLLQPHEIERINEMQRNRADTITSLSVRTAVMETRPVTDTQRTINSEIETINEENLNGFIAFVKENVNAMVKDMMKRKADTTSDIMGDYVTFVSAEKFAKQRALLYNKQGELGDSKLAVCSRIASCVREAVVKESIGSSPTNVYTDVPPPPMTEFGESNIRYMGGLCLARVKRNLVQQVKRKVGTEAQDDILSKITIINQMAGGYQDIDCSSDEFNVTEKRQRFAGGLTFITDPASQFFRLLEIRRSSLHTVNNAKQLGKNALTNATEILNEDQSLKMKWAETVSNLDECNIDVCHSLLYQVMDYYIKIGNNAYRKQLLQTKSVALRAKVIAKRKKSDRKTRTPEKSPVPTKKKKQEPKKPNRTTKTKRKSDGKTRTPEKSPVPTKKKKQEPKKPNRKTKTKRKSLDKAPTKASSTVTLKDLENSCLKCEEDWKSDDEDDWIQCDKCERWLHRKCGGLSQQDAWNEYCQDGVSWACFKCKP